jgi:ribosomal protein L16/L10AE
MTAAEKMTQAGFSRMGSGHGAPVIMTNKAAESAFMDKVSEVQKRDNLTHANALSKARREFPEEFATYNGDTVN